MLTGSDISVNNEDLIPMVFQVASMFFVNIASKSDDFNVDDLLVLIHRVNDVDISDSQPITPFEFTAQAFNALVAERIFG